MRLELLSLGELSMLTVCATSSSHARRSYAHIVWGRLHGRNYLYSYTAACSISTGRCMLRPTFASYIGRTASVHCTQGDLVHPNISVVTQNVYRCSPACMSLYPPPPMIRIQPTSTEPHNGFRYKQELWLSCMGDRTQRNAMQRNDTVDRMDRPRKA